MWRKNVQFFLHGHVHRTVIFLTVAGHLVFIQGIMTAQGYKDLYVTITRAFIFGKAGKFSFPTR